MSADIRPATVKIAAGLQALAVVLAVCAVALAWLGVAAGEQSPANDVRVTRDEILYTGVFLIAAGVMVTGWFGGTLPAVWRRSNIGRVMAVAGAGFYQLALLVLCVCGGMFAFLTLPFRLMPDPFENTFGMSEPAAEPSTPWQLVASGMSFVVIAAILLAILVLLLVPPSHSWYVRSER